MDHTEIRAIRGSLSRAAFARLLGVTSLTVLRWELPEDNKEARRPRAKMIEALRRLAADNVGAADRSAHEEDDDDSDASEPITRSAPPALPQPGAASNEESVVPALIERLGGEDWRRAEDELLRLLSSNLLRSVAARTLATLGLIQVQLFARLDVRGALTALVPILDEAEANKLPVEVCARAHVIGALLFSAPDSRFFDVGRVNAHAARAEALLAPAEDDLRVLLATARISAARFLGPNVVARSYDANRTSLERATAPLARFLAAGLHGVIAGVRGDDAAAARHGAAGLAIAERLELPAIIMAVYADRAWRTLRGSYTPEAVLEITRRAREKAEREHLPPQETLIRVLGCEIEALCRLARFDEADTSAHEALALAKRGGIPRYALAVPLARLYILTDRAAELDHFADSLEAESTGARRALADVHATFIRGLSASLATDFAGAAELLRKVCTAPESTVGIDYLAHMAHAEYAFTQLMLRERDGLRAAFKSCQTLLGQSPSVWDAAFLRRLEAFEHMMQGRFAEARQKLESTLATYQLLGDVVQVTFAKGTLAMVARAAGAPDAEQRLLASLQELERLGIRSPELVRRAQAVSMPVKPNSWQEQSLSERLVVAVERLSTPGLSRALFQDELVRVLGDVFPKHEAHVSADANEALPDTFEKQESSEGGWRIALSGPIDAEERAALRLIGSFVGLLVGQGRTSREPELNLDAVLPAFIAVAPATRTLKGEIARIARSSATILVTGESGSGKEVVARAVHDLSARGDKPYVVFNCASVPRDLFESQLFGHRKGAFTGAVNDSLGVIRAADGGTLFLDEIGELPLDTQPKLLRFLENGEVLPLGEQKARRVDVRVVAATHRDLARLVREGRFREDLYYRLNVVPLEVPPLRERREDIIALARLFVARLTPQDTICPELSADAVSALKLHSWPGNVRELRNVIERAMAYAPVPPLLLARHLRIAAA